MAGAVNSLWNWAASLTSRIVGQVQQDRPSGLPTEKSSNSFWHSEPSEFLLGHRTTAELPDHADIVIIGSGITGTSAARFIAEDERSRDLKVVMLEAREACWGATGRNGGHCQPLLWDRSPEVAAFELKNVAAVRSYIKDHGVPCEWRDVTGCRTFWTPQLMNATSDEIKKLQDSHPDLAKRVQIITSPKDLASHRVQANACGATLTEGAGQLWPYKLITFVLEKLIRSGRLNLQTKTPVTKITHTSSKVTDASTYPWTLHTSSRGTISAKRVILATNGYTSHILPTFADLIVPVRGAMSAQLPPATESGSRLPNSYGFVGARGQNANQDDYLVQRPFEGVPNPKGHLMFGGGRGSATYPSVGEWDDSIVDKGSAKYLRETLLKTLELGGNASDVKELTPSHEWTGIMGWSRDDHPWVGPVPDMPGLFICAGYTGHGMPNGTLCGKAVVEMVLADSQGNDVEGVVKKMVEEGDLPAEYVIRTKRMERARAGPTVKQADEMVILGDQSQEFYRKAEQAKL